MTACEALNEWSYQIYAWGEMADGLGDGDLQAKNRLMKALRFLTRMRSPPQSVVDDEDGPSAGLGEDKAKEVITEVVGADALNNYRRLGKMMNDGPDRLELQNEKDNCKGCLFSYRARKKQKKNTFIH